MRVYLETGKRDDYENNRHYRRSGPISHDSVLPPYPIDLSREV
jgi:hypothetical protein